MSLGTSEIFAGVLGMSKREEGSSAFSQALLRTGVSKLHPMQQREQARKA